MPQEHHRPARFEPGWFDQFTGDVDPALRTQLAHDTATALLTRVRTELDEGEARAVLGRIQALAREDGIDSIAELWAQAPAHSLPGALWRIHLMHTMVVQRSHETAVLFEAGSRRLESAHPAIAGAEEPTGPLEIRALSNRILQGVFAGDFALALERSAAFCRVVAAGAIESADAQDAVDADQAATLTRRARALVDIALDLERCARLWRSRELR